MRVSQLQAKLVYVVTNIHSFFSIHFVISLDTFAMHFPFLQAVKLKKKAWWENAKVWLVIGLVLLIVVLVIVIATTSPNASSEAAGTSSPEMVAGVGGGAAVEDKGTGIHASPHSL